MGAHDLTAPRETRRVSSAPEPQPLNLRGKLSVIESGPSGKEMY